MTLKAFLTHATKQLEAAGITTARLDCLVLLEDALDTDRTQLLAHDDQVLASEQITNLQTAIERRAKHEPLAYIRGKSEFYGREFLVTQTTLEPRPETETMITRFLNWLQTTYSDDVNDVSVIDVGTGSGAIAITIKLERPRLHVTAIEINNDALKVARRNANRLNAEVDFVRGDLIKPVTQDDSSSTVLLCNLPYVPSNHTINRAAMQEPEIAIFGGPDGLDLYRKLFNQIDALTHKPTAIFTESLPFQHHGLASLARQHGFIQASKDDFIQQFVQA